MPFIRKFVCSLLFGLFVFPVQSLELIYRQDADLLFRTWYKDQCSICNLFTANAQKDSTFSILLNDCQKVGISECYDTIIEWMKSKNIVEIDSVRLSKSIEKFLKSNDFLLTEDEKNSLKNLSYLSSIYRTIDNRHGNNSLIYKLKKNDITPNREKNKISKKQEIKRNRDIKYNIIKMP